MAEDATSVNSLRESASAGPHPADDAPWHRFVRRMQEQRQQQDETDDDHVEQLEISVAAPRKAALSGIGRFENNLARKGVIELKPIHGGSSDSATQSKRDLVGKTTLTFTMGALGPLEMDLIAWTMGQWHRSQDHVSFSLRELARSLGVSWKGQLGTSIKNSFLRIKAMTITGRVWDAQEKKHITQSFNIFDRVEMPRAWRGCGPAGELHPARRRRGDARRAVAARGVHGQAPG
jgi:hypothetical protein